jgi:hypothetical protein
MRPAGATSNGIKLGTYRFVEPVPGLTAEVNGDVAVGGVVGLDQERDAHQELAE